MKGSLTERNLVVILFVMVLITFSFAQKETKKMEEFYNGTRSSIGTAFSTKQQTATIQPVVSAASVSNN